MFAAVELDPPVHRIVERRDAGRHLEADRARRARRFELGNLFRGELQAGAVVLPGLAARFRVLSLLAQPIGGAVAVIGASVRDQLRRCGAIALEPLRLEIGRVRTADLRPFIPVEPEPSQAVENAGDHVGRRALDVGVFDAQDERAAVPPRVEPVEERRARAADVQIAGGRGRKTNAWDHVHP